MDDKKTFNTIYVECFDEIWDYYFKIEDLIYQPKILIGVERQRKIALQNQIIFYNRTEINNQEIKFEYDLSYAENNILEILLNDEILSKMYIRNSFDSTIPNKLLYELTRNYAIMWFYFIHKFKLDVLILHEMPHLPYTYIGYLIFQKLKLRIIFSATLQFKNRAYFTDSLENYNLFKEDIQYYLTPKSNQSEDLLYYDKLKEHYSIKKEDNSVVKKNSFLKIFLIYLYKFLFPYKSERLKFHSIWGGKFFDQPDRIYYLLILKNLIKKLNRKIYYKKIADKTISSNLLNLFYAMHFEPELAVYPLAGNNFCQLSNLLALSERIGDKGVIYVKEHPWVFNFSKVKGIIRDKEFYDKLSNQKNIRFIDYCTDIDEIITKIDAVVTLTGTIGWEVFFKQIPVLYFGYPWYAGLPGMKKFKENIDINKFLLECKDEYNRISYKNIYNKLKNDLWEVSSKMNASDGFDLDEKSIGLKTAIENFRPILNENNDKI